MSEEAAYGILFLVGCAFWLVVAYTAIIWGLTRALRIRVKRRVDAVIESIETRSFPAVTDEMRQRGLTWARTTDGQFIEVCDFCGGNCGQCGITARVGNVPANMEHMMKKMGMFE